MHVEIDREKVRGVQLIVGQILNDKGFNVVEVLFGLAELQGRVVLTQTGGSVIEKLDMLKTLTEHAERTIRTGWIATGGNTTN